MTGSQANRRSRIWHRFLQIGLAPSVVGLTVAGLFFPAAPLGALALLAARGTYYFVASGRWLSGFDRLFCAAVGLLCDMTYGTSFLSALVQWSVKDPSILRFGRPGPAETSRP